jgi:hypothetical protein
MLAEEASESDEERKLTMSVRFNDKGPDENYHLYHWRDILRALRICDDEMERLPRLISKRRC